MPLESGDTVQHYRLIEKIGEGGMGVVWKAEDTRLHRHVALKFVPEDHTEDASAVDRHLREARAASALNHPNICAIHDIGEWEGRRFLVMELLEGRPLDRVIDGSPMAIDDAVDLAAQMADALDTAHAKGIVHRDIKPANVFMTDRGQAKMLDFGLAKLAVTPGADDATRTAMDQTTPGSVMGTVSYMSPEQALGKDLDARTDVFSLGVVLYEMITGRRAFAGDTSAAVFDHILNRAPTAPVDLNREVPAELARIVGKALEKNPALRYQSAAGFLADLNRLRRDGSAERVDAPPATTSGDMVRRRRVLIAAVFMMAIVSVAVWRQVGRNGDAGDGGTTAPAATSGGPSIAVLPFENAGGDEEQAYFSDGLTEDIITELSRYPELSVIARSSTDRYRGADVDLELIREKLGVRYVLQGSVRRAGDRIKVGVQLSDTTDRRMIWGTNYERELTTGDLFALQDDLTQHVVSAIADTSGALARAGMSDARRKPPANLESYDCVLRVYAYMQDHTAPNHLAAMDCLEKVVEDEPGYATGKAWLGYLYADAYHHRWNERFEGDEALDRPLALATEAVSLDPTSHVSHGALALTHFIRGEYGRGRREAYRTIELGPNNALWLALISNYLAQQEDFEHAVPMAMRAQELSPHPPRWIHLPIFLRDYSEGRYDDALPLAQEIEMHDFRTPLFHAATYGQLGLGDEGAGQVARIRERWEEQYGTPADLDVIRQELIARHAYAPTLADHLLDGVRKAGFEASAD